MTELDIPMSLSLDARKATIRISSRDLKIQRWLNRKIDNPLIKLDHDDLINRMERALMEKKNILQS